MLLQLYLHFPFCKRKCFYCDFCSAQASAQTVAAYCFALEKEIRLMGERYPDAVVNTVFLGGGTPSVVSPEAMRGVLAQLRRSFFLLPDAEFTTEANPGTLTREWLDMALEMGVNRLSLGVQSANDKLLAAIGRIHTFEQAQAAVQLARAAGIRNLSLDAMFGLPGQRLTDHMETLAALHALHPDHISAYSLILEEGTPLEAMVQNGMCTLPTEDETAAMYEQGIARLENAGYHRYEVSNFAREGRECRHNIGYWQGAWYLGLGVAAHSMLPPDAAQRAAGAVRVRRGNAEDVQAYIAALTDGRPAPAETQPVNAEDAMFETMMLGLRMTRGVSEQAFEAQHGLALTHRYGPQLDRLTREGLGLWLTDGVHGRSFALTPRGIEVQNDVLLRFMQND